MRVNLLPPEVKERQTGRRRTGLAVALGVLVLAGLGVFYVLQQMRLNGLEEDLRAQQTVNAQLSAKIEELRQFDDLQRELSATRDLVASLLADEVHWSGILRDLSLVIPGKAWLSTFSGTLATGTAATPPGQAPVEEEPTGLIGQMTFTGFGLSHRDTALLLSRLEEVEGFVNPWASLSELTIFGATEVAQFNGSADLSDQALASARGDQG